MSDGRIPEEINNEEQQNREIFAMGEEARKFLTSDLARFITDSAEARVYAAVEILKRVVPTDTEEIRRLQNIIEKFEHYQKCLEEMVAAGDSAYQIYLLKHQSD